MNIGFYSAGQGVIEMQTAMDVTSNNVANVQTNGYKTIRPSFADLIYTEQNKLNEDVHTGHGVRMAKTDLMYKTGNMMHTERDLDFATPSEGLFAIEQPDGEIMYTKDGAFFITQTADDTWTLVDGRGGFVLDYNGEHIDVQFKDDGTVDNGDITEKLGVYVFDNPYGLDLNGDNYFIETESSGVAVSDISMPKKNGYLESSTVDLAEEMVKVIQFQRAFQFNTKMVQTHDELQNIVNNLR